MDKKTAQRAISAALSGNWDEALLINKEIVGKNPKDIDALNRLSRAYAELGDIPKARSTAKKVLQIDNFNTIALKAIDKWKNLKRGDTYTSGPSSAQVFLEEPGKTKILPLLYLGSSKTLAKLDSGDEVKLNTHSHKASVTTNDGKYIGRLPDDLSCRLKKFIKHGNEYRIFIKSVEKNEVKVFIREIKRAKKLSDYPSFSTEKINYVSFTPPEFVYENKPLKDEEEKEDEE